MGIKDRVINILFDDEELNDSSSQDKTPRRKHEDTSSLIVDTGPIFIDAGSKKPSEPKEENTHTDQINELVKEIKQEDSYQMTENISPIFGVQKTEGRSRKSSQRKNDNSMYEGLLNAGLNTSTSSYSSVIISPIYGPIENKPSRKNAPRTQRKQADPFTRSIDDSGEFKTLFSEEQATSKEEELDFESDAPAFKEVKEDKPAVDEKLGDTDRLSKISDRINQIKNEAAHIYSGQNEHIESRHETSVKESHSSISDLIHNFQKEDFKPDFSILNKPKEEVIENPPEEETIVEEVQDTFEETTEEAAPAFEEPIQKDPVIEDTTQLSLEDTLEQTNNVNEEAPSSIDDIFDDDVEDGKDLFSDLFGDE